MGHVTRAIQMLQALAVRPDALPAAPAYQSFASPNSIGPGTTGGFPPAVRDAITRLSQTPLAHAARILHSVVGWTGEGAAEQVGHQLANATAARDPAGAAMAFAAVPLLAIPGGGKEAEGTARALASEARMPAQAALRDATTGEIIGVGRNHMVAMDNALARGHDYVDAIDGFTDHTGVVRPGEPIPKTSWMTRDDAEAGWAHHNDAERGYYGATSEGLRQEGEYRMQHEFERAHMNLRRAEQGMDPLDIPAYRTTVLGHTLQTAMDRASAGPFANIALDNAKVAEAINAGGTTVHPVTGEKAGAGFWVANPDHTQGLPGPATAADVAAFRAKHADALAEPGAHLGGWVNPANGQGEINVSVHHPDLESALARGRDWSQHEVGETAADGSYVQGHKVPLYTDDELGLLSASRRERQRTGFENADAAVPPTEALKAAALTPEGQFHKNWYEDMMQGFRELTGPDADRFAAEFASTSPHTSVEDNLEKAWRLHQSWDAAGRPTDPAALGNLFRQQHGWVPAYTRNATQALTAADPAAMEMYGPKVNAFHKDFGPGGFRTAIDTWMAKIFGVDPAHLGVHGAEGAAAGTGEYIRTAGQIRQAARELTNETGTLWTPKQVQAAVWGWAKTGPDVSAYDLPPTTDILRPYAAEVGRTITPAAAPKLLANPYDPSALQPLLENIERSKRGFYNYGIPLTVGGLGAGAAVAGMGEQPQQ